MRLEREVTAISWIPSEAIDGPPKLPFELGIGHYDEPPPDPMAEGVLESAARRDRFRATSTSSARTRKCSRLRPLVGRSSRCARCTLLRNREVVTERTERIYRRGDGESGREEGMRLREEISE